jgi:uncharacterized protein YuzB (UPF0349 family)
MRLIDMLRVSGLGIDAARELADRFVTRGIIERGTILWCDLCSATDFYSVEELEPQFKCKRCRQRRPLVHSAWKHPREPQWYYGLSEIVFQAISANGDVPILALSRLSEGVESFQYMPEASIRFPDGTSMEIDLWAFVNGEIVLGEAKIGDVLEPTAGAEGRRIAKFRALARDLAFDRLVCATSQPTWRPRTVTKAESELARLTSLHWFTDLGPVDP